MLQLVDRLVDVGQRGALHLVLPEAVDQAGCQRLASSFSVETSDVAVVEEGLRRFM